MIEVTCLPSGDVAVALDPESAVFAAKTLCDDDALAFPIQGRRPRARPLGRDVITRVVIEVELGNDAMETAAEVGLAVNRSLLRDSRSALDPLAAGDEGAIEDANGNNVGSWRVVEEYLA